MNVRGSARGALLGVFVLAASLARADEATLDPLFGTGGTVLTPFDLSGISRIASQADGKILVPGFVFDPGPVPVIARYEANGTLDTTFGTGGSVTTTYVGAGGWATSAAEDPDGKIVIAGLAYGANVGVARFATDGSPDLTFGTGGSVSTSVGGAFLNANTGDMLVDPDGNIVVLATVSPEALPGDTVAVLRYLPSGALDASFGAGGIAFVSHALYTFGSGVTRQADGKIVVVGSKTPSLAASSQAFVTRLDGVSGLPDVTFGSAGSAFLTAAGYSEFTDVVQQPDGKLAISGSTATGVLVARYDADGDPDPSFGTGGVVVSDFVAAFEAGNGLVLQPDGKIVVTGSSGNTGGGAFRVARYDASGVLDPTFGVGGTTTIQMTPGNDFGYQILRRPDGKLVIGGGINSTQQIGLARLGTGCLSSPALDCKQSTAPRASALKVKSGLRPALKFKWAKGESTTLGEYGSPDTTTSYQVCLYDTSPTGSRVLQLDAPAAGTCGTGPCWSATGTGFRYKSKTGAPNGLTGLKLVSSTVGRARVLAKAKGSSLAAPPLPLAVPLRAQVLGSNGTCVEADFSTAGVKRNDASAFSAKSD